MEHDGDLGLNKFEMSAKEWELLDDYADILAVGSHI
jgi:hypothetical protein